jgi:hypothetical protein
MSAVEVFLAGYFAGKGANADITSLTALAAIPAVISAAFAAKGANADITSLSALTSINGGQIAGLRNPIINGDFRVWQRGASISAPAGVVTYAADRWYVATAGAATTVTQSAVGFGPYVSAPIMSVAGAAGLTVTIGQRIASTNIAGNAGQTVTYSLWAYQTSGSTQSIYCGSSYANSTDNFAAQTAIANTAMTPAVPSGVWTKVSCQIALPNGAAQGVNLQLGVGASGALGAGQTFAIAKAQLELGTTASTFEQRPYGLEWVLCRHYHRQWTINAGGVPTATGLAVATTAFWVTGVCGPVDDMRVLPTISSTAASTFQVVTTSGLAVTAITSLYATPSGTIFFAGSVASGLTIGNAVQLQSSPSNPATIIADGEL